MTISLGRRSVVSRTYGYNQQKVRRQEVFTSLKANFSLPSPTKTVLEIIRLCNMDDTSLQDIADRIETDPSLAAEIINYANSAYMATGIQVASVHKATVKLGMRTVMILALGLSMFKGNSSGECLNFNYPLFWRSSLAEALAARELAKLNDLKESDELFICGLLSHMGRLALATIFPEDYSTLLREMRIDLLPKELELKKFGIDSAELTTELFFQWGLPARYALAAGFHEDLTQPELGSGDTFRAAVILGISHDIAQLCQYTVAHPEIVEEIENSCRNYSVVIGNFAETFRGIVASWHDLGKKFEISTPDCHLYTD